VSRNKAVTLEPGTCSQYIYDEALAAGTIPIPPTLPTGICPLLAIALSSLTALVLSPWRCLSCTGSLSRVAYFLILCRIAVHQTLSSVYHSVLTTLILSILMWGVTLLFCPRCTVFIPFVIHALQSISCYAWIARVYEKYKSMITLPLFIFCVLKLKTLLFSRHRSTVQ